MTKIWDKTKKFLGFSEEEINERQNFTKPSLKGPLVSLSDEKNVRPDLEILISEPKDQDESLSIANALRSDIPVIINLKHLETNDAKRLFDFICGTAYAINGHYRKLDDHLMLFTPGNINIIEEEASRSFRNLEENSEIRLSNNSEW